MNVIARSTVGCCTVLALTGCGAMAQEPSSSAPALATSPSSTRPHEASPRPVPVPDGRYSRVVLATDAAAAGLSRELVPHLLGEDGRLPMTLELDRERFAVTVLNDLATTETGTVGYDSAGRMVLTSLESRVPQVLDWRLVDGDLILTLVGATPQERFMVNGRYAREAK